jgi:hypothetical protein
MENIENLSALLDALRKYGVKQFKHGPFEVSFGAEPQSQPKSVSLRPEPMDDSYRLVKFEDEA